MFKFYLLNLKSKLLVTEFKTTSRIYKIVEKDLMYAVGTVLGPDARYTTTGEDFLSSSLQAHFPGCLTFPGLIIF